MKKRLHETCAWVCKEEVFHWRCQIDYIIIRPTKIHVIWLASNLKKNDLSKEWLSNQSIILLLLLYCITITSPVILLFSYKISVPTFIRLRIRNVLLPYYLAPLRSARFKKFTENWLTSLGLASWNSVRCPVMLINS